MSESREPQYVTFDGSPLPLYKRGDGWQMWSLAIAHAEKLALQAEGKRAIRLRAAVAVFTQNREEGEPWPVVITK